MLAPTHRSTARTVAAGAALLLLAGCGAESALSPAAEGTDLRSSAVAAADVAGKIVDVTGKRIGKVDIRRSDGLTMLVIRADGLTPGFHGMHLHSVGLCEGAGGFVSAGGHIVGDEGSTHGLHLGDLPSLFVGDDGTGVLRYKTVAFKPNDLLDADGSAIVLHAGRDNYANIPERYSADGPDEETLKTGDSGARYGCGVIGD